MNGLIKRTPPLFAAMLLLSMILVFPLPASAVPTTYVKVINPLTGDSTFMFYTNCSHVWTDPEMKPGTCLGLAVGYEFIANVTVVDVGLGAGLLDDLATWQLNLTFNKDILNIKDIFTPADHVFAGRPLTLFPKDINNTGGYVTWGMSVGPPAPPTPPSVPFNGTGTLCQIRFNITAHTPPMLSSDLVIDKVSPKLTTFLLDVDVNDIVFTEVNGYYEILYKVPPVIIPKPYLEAVDPLDGDHLIVKGEPLAGPIVGTPEAAFDVNIMAKNHVNESNIIGVQTCAISYPYELYNVTGTDAMGWATEGDFYNNTAWAPYGTFWMAPMLDHDFPAPGKDTLYLCLILWPNPATEQYDWGVFPDGEGLFATVHFEVRKQEEFPWEDSTGAINLTEVFPNEMFLNSTLDFIPHDPPIDAQVKIVGYVTGRMIDVYVGGEPGIPYPAPYGGQGINKTADMFWPQKKIYIWAVVMYNMWPEQNKVVTFEIRDPDWNIVTVLTGVTDADGVAYASFRIPWPEHEKYLCHVYTIIASVDIACIKVWDWLWFHFDYLTRWVKVTTDKAQYAHCEWINITITFKSKAMQDHWVMIVMDLKDELQYAVGFCAAWINVGGAVWCTYKEYTVTFIFHVYKHVHAGVGTIHVNSLSTLPSLCGYAWCPEYRDPDTGETPTFVVLSR